MKKILIIILFILSAVSIGFLIYNFNELNNYDKIVDEKQEELNKMNEDLKDEEKAKEERNKQITETKEKNKAKIEELEKWQKQTKQVESLL